MDTHNITHVLQFLSCNLQHRNYTHLSKECMHTVRVGLPPLIMVMATIPACSYSHWGLLLQPLLDRAGIRFVTWAHTLRDGRSHRPEAELVADRSPRLVHLDSTGAGLLVFLPTIFASGSCLLH